jgi:hypothetical protein
MAHVRLTASLIDEAGREIAARAEKEIDARVENVAEVTDHGSVIDYASGHEDSGSSEAGSDEAANAHAPSDESSRRYCFGASTSTLGRFVILWKRVALLKG